MNEPKVTVAKTGRTLSNVAVVAAVLVLFCLLIYWLQFGYAPSNPNTSGESESSNTSPFSTGQSVAETKATLLTIVTHASTTPLSQATKASILREFGGSRTAQYHFTPAELKIILSALNARK